MVQLDQQTFLQVAAANAERIKLMNSVQNSFDLIIFGRLFKTVLIQQCLPDVIQRRLQVTLIINGIDNGHRDDHVMVTERCQSHLPEQMILETFFGAALVVKVRRLDGGHAARYRHRHVIGIFPVTVNGQLIGNIRHAWLIQFVITAIVGLHGI